MKSICPTQLDRLTLLKIAPGHQVGSFHVDTHKSRPPSKKSIISCDICSGNTVSDVKGGVVFRNPGGPVS